MKTPFSARGLMLLAASGLVLAACGAGDDSDGSAGGVSSDGDLSVAAAFYPLAFVAERVGAEHVSVENLTQPGVEPHDLELTGQQVGLLTDADVVIHLNGFQPALDEAIEQSSSGMVLDAAAIVELLPDSHDHDDDHEDVGEDHDDHEDDHHDDHEDEGEDHDDHGHEDEDHDDHGHDDHAHEEDDGHDHGDLDGDPHLWLDPTNLVAVADSVAEALAELDPDNADTYRSNADDLTAELTTLDDEFTTGVAQCERSLIVVSHEAFGYLTTKYGLEQLGVAGLDPDSEPSPARVAQVHDTVRDEGITTVFYEPLTSPEVVQSLADDLGLETAVLDPIEGLTDETADEDYFSLMRENLDAIRAANGCE